MELPQPVDVDRTVVRPDRLDQGGNSRRSTKLKHCLVERIEHVVHWRSVLETRMQLLVERAGTTLREALFTSPDAIDQKSLARVLALPDAASPTAFEKPEAGTRPR